MKTQFISLLIALLAGLLPLQAQQVSISGIVTDKKLNEPIIGASVVVKGTSNGCITDLDGNFQLNNVASGSTLVVSYIGYQTQEIPVQKGKTSYQVTLSEDTQTLDEVVVVGFGTQKKVNLTGAVASVDNKKLESRPVTSVGQALQGVVPGLNVSIPDAGGKLDANPSFNIRGTGNLGTGSSASPLVLIDGVAGDLNQLNPQDIDNISVLMDAASAAIYGSRAPFGVILVTTKKGKQGKTSISYSNNLRWSRPTNIPDMLDAYTLHSTSTVPSTTQVPVKHTSSRTSQWIVSSSTCAVRLLPLPIRLFHRTETALLSTRTPMTTRTGHVTSSTRLLSDKSIT